MGTKQVVFEGMHNRGNITVRFADCGLEINDEPNRCMVSVAYSDVDELSIEKAEPHNFITVCVAGRVYVTRRGKIKRKLCHLTGVVNTDVASVRKAFEENCCLRDKATIEEAKFQDWKRKVHGESPETPKGTVILRHKHDYCDWNVSIDGRRIGTFKELKKIADKRWSFELAYGTHTIMFSDDGYYPHLDASDAGWCSEELTFELSASQPTVEVAARSGFWKIKLVQV